MDAYTVSMRVYVPAVLSDLSVPLPPVRSGVLCVPEAAMSGEDIEVLEDDAITEAALSSLELARETEGAGAARVKQLQRLPMIVQKHARISSLKENKQDAL